MEGQMDIFDFLHDPQPGQWLDDGEWEMGEPIDFDDLQDGMLVWVNHSTESREFWKCLRVEKSLVDGSGNIWRRIFGGGTKNGKHYISKNENWNWSPMHGTHRFRKVL